MASPLESVDWDNLAGEELTTVLRLLCSALQERYVVGRMSFLGDITGHPDLNPHPSQLKRYFPYGNNNPKWMGDSWPCFALNNDINDLMLYASAEYVYKPGLDALLGQSAPFTFQQRRNYSFATAAFDSSYPNRLYEIAGYTDLIDISTGSAVELKKFYDLLKLLKWVNRFHGLSWDNSSSNNNTEYVGEFDLSQSHFFLQDQNGADFYGSNNYRDAALDTGGYTSFVNGHSNLFSAGNASHLRSDQNNTTHPLQTGFYYHWRFRTTGSAGNLPGSPRGYLNWIHAFRVKEIYDWSVARSVIGFTGKPNQVERYDYISDVTYTMDHTGFSYTPDAENILRKATPTFTDIDADNHTVEFNENLNLANMPASIPPENDESLVLLNMATALDIEFWDYEGGFLYHTDF